jgi:hypothetical protein
MHCKTAINRYNRSGHEVGVSRSDKGNDFGKIRMI